MDQATYELRYRIEHRHPDGSWGEMREESLPDDPAAHDPERHWGFRRLFRCTSCDEAVTVSDYDEDNPEPEN